MSDDIAKLEFQRMQLAASLSTVAESMRNCVTLVEHFANSVQNFKVTSGISVVQSDDTPRGRKRKAVDHDEDPDSKKPKRKPRDPNAPKRPPSSYILFQNDIRKELKEKHPNVANNELLAMIAKRWTEMNDKDKAHYNEAVANAKEQYSQDKKAYDSRTPEEVAAANEATARAQAEKKTKGRAPKAPAPPAPAAAPVPKPPAAETSPSSDSTSISDSDSSDEEEVAATVNGKATKPKHTVTDSEEEEDEEEEDDDDRPPIVVVKKGRGKAKTPPTVTVASKDKRKRAGKA